ncbi:MAG: penicillin-binding protein activator [Wenzhouxiangellaceae bacterium]|nr:penicillin-binding protein activator [Wenzhouxiangellaceae bacterium]
MAPMPSYPSTRAHPLAACLLALLLAGCAATPPGPERDADVSDPAELSAQGRHAEAARAWLERADEQGDAARLAAAEAWNRAGQPAEARALIDDLVRTQLDREQRFRLDFLRADLALSDRDFDTAARLLAVPADAVPDGLEDRYARLVRRLEERDPESLDARLRRVRNVVTTPGFEPPDAVAPLIDVPLRTLRAAADLDSDAVVAPWLDLAVAIRANLLDDDALAEALAEWETRYGRSAEVVDAIADWITTWKAERPWPARVAVLLPGQGPLVRAGDALRDGLLSAWLDLPAERRPELDFLYLDDAPDAAVGAWFQAREAGARYLVGPLDRARVEPLLNLPLQQLPILLLNRPPPEVALPTPSQPVSILALPPEEEAELAALRALVEGHRRALVVAQDSDFGRRVADRFVETFELGGGRLLGRADYPPGEPDQTERLGRLFEIDRSEARIQAMRSLLGGEMESEPQRRTDVDVVFLAAREDDARRIVPQLKFLGLGGLPVLATSHVFPGSGRALGDLDGVAFPISPWLLPGTEHAEARRAAERVFPAIESAPTFSQLHALGRDALRLLPWLPAMERDPLLVFDGHVGRLRLADGVTLERDLPWARIRDGELKRD